jgi:small subunit ribosomal protein S20
MPNTASAERRVRNSARRAARNQSTESRLKTLERNYLQAVTGQNKEQASTALRNASSALDKAVKVGVIHRRTANRKKSRLAIKLATLK